MALLGMIQKVCRRLAIPAPSVVVGSTDQQVIQLLNLANEEGEQLAQRARWQVLQAEATFTSVATESQGAMTTLAGASFGWICENTVWNRTQNRPILPITDIQWQQMKASAVTGPYTMMRIRGGNFIALPTMTAGHTVAFEWMTKNWCESSGGTDQSVWTADTDTGLLAEDLMALGVIWRWKAFKGLAYSEDFAIYERAVDNASARDGAKPRLLLSSGSAQRFLSNRSIVDGNWS